MPAQDVRAEVAYDRRRQMLTPHRIALLAAAFVLTIASGAFTQGVPVDQATDEQKVAAQEAFAEARTAFDERRFIDALRGFRASFEIVGSPNTHLMLTHALRELGRNAEAYDELANVVSRAEAAAASDPKYEQAAALAREERDALRPAITLLTVEVVDASADAKLVVGGRTIAPESWGSPIAVDPGTVTVVLSDATGTVAREMVAEAGGDASLSLTTKVTEATPPPPPPQPSPESSGWQWGGTQRFIAYAVAGVGVAALGASAVTGAMAQSKYSELEDACGDAPCPERQDDIDSGRTFQLVSNVTLIAGLVAVTGGVVLFFTAPDDEPSEGATALRVGPGTFTLEGSF